MQIGDFTSVGDLKLLKAREDLSSCSYIFDAVRSFFTIFARKFQIKLNNMRKHLLMLVVAFLSVVAMAQTQHKPSAQRLAQLKGGVASWVDFSKKNMGVRALGGRPQLMNLVPAAEEGADHTLQGTTWGLLNTEDGRTWYYTQKFEYDADLVWYYSKSEIEIFDENYEKLTTLTIDVPKGCKVNSIQVFGTATTKFFDRDAKTWEVMVYMHEVGSNGEQIHTITAYDNKGVAKASYDAYGAIFFDASEGFSSYQRVALVQQNTVTEGEGAAAVTKDVHTITLLKPGSFSKPAPAVEQTFTVDTELINYSDGPFFNMYKVDGKPYYTLSHYAKPYMSGYDNATWEPIVAEDNSYLTKVYDKDFKEVASLSVPVKKGVDALYTFYAFGMFSYEDLTTKFTDDGKFNFVITRYDYISSTDDYEYAFDVYDQDGKKVKTLCDLVQNWQPLSNVPGQPEQMSFLVLENDVQRIRMIDIPSGERVTEFEAVVDGYKLSSNYDRVGVDNTYKYVIGIGEATMDEQENVIARIGWYDKEGTPERYVTFNLGPNAELFTPYIAGATLNPYLFNTDAKREYFYMAKVKPEGSNVVEDVLCLADENGNTIRTFSAPSDGATFSSGDIFDATTANPKLVFSYHNADADIYDICFYHLPFNKWSAGGDGTEANPYVITSAGDMMQISQDPAAHYVLGADIDMGDYVMDWQPVEAFTGTLDGKGHTISGLRIKTDKEYVGLFQTTSEGAVIKNLVLVNPVAEVQKYNYFGSFIAAYSLGTKFENIHIYNGAISGADTEAVVGGICGEASMECSFIGCSVQDVTINVPLAQMVGGIVGDTRTTSKVKACYVSGSITADASLGGIVGVTGMNSTVSNCHADVVLTAQNTVGGIVGRSGRAPIDHCYVAGEITATKGNFSGNYCAGGIVGLLESDWAGATAAVISGCVSMVEMKDMPAGAKAVHRIAGMTIADEVYEEGEEVKTDAGLSANYATTIWEGVTADVAKADGADVAADALTTEFFTTLGYAYGTDSIAPWKGNNIPVLYFEEEARSIALNAEDVLLAEGESFSLVATVYGVNDASEVAFSSSNEEVATVENVVAEGNKATATIQWKGEGSAVITASVGALSATCQVLLISGIGEVLTPETGLAIQNEAGRILVPGATALSLYAADGKRVVAVAGEQLSLTGISNGVYVVVATDNAGRRTSAKVMVK